MDQMELHKINRKIEMLHGVLDVIDATKGEFKEDADIVLAKQSLYNCIRKLVTLKSACVCNFETEPPKAS